MSVHRCSRGSTPSPGFVEHSLDGASDSSGIDGYASICLADATERFDVIVDPVGGDVRTRDLALLKPGGRLIVAGNASDDWTHQVDTNQLWLTGRPWPASTRVPICPRIRRSCGRRAGGRRGRTW